MSPTLIVIRNQCIYRNSLTHNTIYIYTLRYAQREAYVLIVPSQIIFILIYKVPMTKPVIIISEKEDFLVGREQINIRTSHHRGVCGISVTLDLVVHLEQSAEIGST